MGMTTTRRVMRMMRMRMMMRMRRMRMRMRMRMMMMMMMRRRMMTNDVDDDKCYEQVRPHCTAFNWNSTLADAPQV
eukprot:1294397-Amphidinium_carterae.1